MTAVDDSFLRRLQERLGVLFLFGTVVLLFLAYPMALLPPALRLGEYGFNNLPFQVSVPILLLGTLLAIPVVVVGRSRPPWPLFAAVGTYVLFWLMAYLRFPGHLPAAIELLGYAAVPLAAAMVRHDGSVFRRQYIVRALFGLWLWQIVLMLIAFARRDFQPVGTAGNINWSSALVLGLSPWAFLAVDGWLARRLPRPRQRRLTAALIVALPTFAFLLGCRSRATVAALLALAVVFAIIHMKRRAERVAFAAFIVTLLVTVFVVFLRFAPDFMIRTIRRDVRLPLYSSTVRLIAADPWGTGPGNFRQRFTPFRANSTYMLRQTAAHTTIHPHNELLNVTAQLGVPAGIAFFAMLLPLILGRRGDAVQTCARFTATVILAQSMLDMPAVQPPTNLLGLLCLGWCWPMTGFTIPAAGWQCQLRRAVGPLVLLAAAIGGIALAQRDIRYDLAARKGELYRRISREYGRNYNSAKSRKFLKRAYAAFFTATQVDPDSLDGHYEAGRLALSLGQLEAAQEHLTRVQDHDPNFAHLNALLGQLALRQVRTASPAQRIRLLALAQHCFLRERQLYPRETRPLHDLYNFCLGTGQYSQLPTLYDRATTLYAERAENQHFNRLDPLLAAWLTAVKAGDQQRAIKMARQITGDIHTEHLDPLFVELANRMQWPLHILRSGFSELDAAYWQQELRHHRLLGDAGSGAYPSIPELTAWFTRNYRIDREQKVLQLPANFWKRSRGSRLSVYAMYSALVLSNGGWCIFQLDERKQPQQALVSHRLRLYAVDLDAGTCELIPPQDPRRRVQWVPGKTVVYFPVEEYFLRNQILGSLLARRFPKDNFLSTRPPSLQLIYLMQTCTGAQAPPLNKLKAFCWTAPIHVYDAAYKRSRQQALQQQRKNRPAP